MHGHRDFSRTGNAATPDQGDRGGRVMGRPIGPLLPAPNVEAAMGQRLHCRRRERFVGTHARQDAREPLGQHGLAGARRTHHQQAVAASCGNLQGSACLCLALDVGQIGIARRFRFRATRRTGERHVAIEVCTDFEEVGGAEHLGATDQRGLGYAFHRHDKSTPAGMGLVGHRQRPTNRTQHPGERQLTGELHGGQQIARDLTGCREDADGDREVETPAFLGQIGRGQVDGDAARRKLEPTVDDRGADPVFCFFDLGFGQTDDGEARQSVGKMNLDFDLRRVHAGEGTTANDGNAHRPAACNRPGIRRRDRAALRERRCAVRVDRAVPGSARAPAPGHRTPRA